MRHCGGVPRQGSMDSIWLSLMPPEGCQHCWYMIIFVASVLIVSLDEKDLVTNFTAVAATLNNVGPGLGLVGPAGNFSGFSNLSKLVLSFDMLAGRLELIPMLMIFVPSVWSVKRKKK